MALIVGILLRVSGLGMQSLWIGEVATARLSSHSFATFLRELFGTIGSEANQPLYFLLIRVPKMYVMRKWRSNE